MIGSTGDAATPYEAGRRRWPRDLDRGALLTVELDGHIALGDSTCATEAATRYLVDLDHAGAGCPLLSAVRPPPRPGL